MNEFNRLIQDFNMKLLVQSFPLKNEVVPTLPNIPNSEREQGIPWWIHSGWYASMIPIPAKPN